MTIKVVGYRDTSTVYPFEYKPGYTFVVNGNDYDWLVVFERLRSPCQVTGDPHKTILATWEPTSIKHYSKVYTRQFAHLLTNRPREAENHPNYHLGRGYFPWFLERSHTEAANSRHNLFCNRYAICNDFCKSVTRFAAHTYFLQDSAAANMV